jgi:hydrogenase maturation protein HypF
MISIAAEEGTGQMDDFKRPYIGISGGVAYDLPIVGAFVRLCREKGAFPVLHSRVPPGDGGISVGQAALAGLEPE